MKLENRLPAEGINASHEHPLKEFAWLVLGVVGALALLAVAVSHGAQWLAPRIPFEYETRLVGDRLATQPSSERGRAVQAELQRRARKRLDPRIPGIIRDILPIASLAAADLVEAGDSFDRAEIFGLLVAKLALDAQP